MADASSSDDETAEDRELDELATAVLEAEIGPDFKLKLDPVGHQHTTFHRFS